MKAPASVGASPHPNRHPSGHRPSLNEGHRLSPMRRHGPPAAGGLTFASMKGTGFRRCVPACDRHSNT